MNDETEEFTIVRTCHATPDAIDAYIGPEDYGDNGGTWLTIRRPDWPAEHWPPAVGDLVRVTVPKAKFLARPSGGRS